MNKISILWCGWVLAASGFAESGTLTLERVLELARKNSPELKASRLNTQAAEKEAAVSGRWENPELAFDVEGVGGNLNGFRETEYTVGIAQTFNRGGKRKNKRAVAHKAFGVALLAEEEKELTLLSEVLPAFIDVAAWQEINRVRFEQERAGRMMVEAAKARFEAGGSELEVVWSELALKEILLSRSGCTSELKIARLILASHLGIPEEEMAESEISYYELQPLEDWVVNDAHPSLQKLQAQIEETEAMAALARSEDVADITLGIGYRHQAADDVNTLVFGISMPLNFIRVGKIEQAALLKKAGALRAEYEGIYRKYRQRLSVLKRQYNHTMIEAEMIRDHLMPKMEKAYELSRIGYKIGQVSWVELIDARQQLVEIRLRHIDILRNTHIAWNEITKFMQTEIQQ